MTSVSGEITIGADSERQFIVPEAFLVEASTAAKPRGDVQVVFKIDGDGSLNAAAEVKQLHESTNSAGQVLFEWWEYPKYEPGRELRSRVVASCPDEDVTLGLSLVLTSGGVEFKTLPD